MDSDHTWTHTHTRTHTHTHTQSAALMITLWMCLAHIGPTDGWISVAYVLPLLFQWEQLKHITLLTTLFMQQLHSLPGGILFPFQNMQQTFLNTPIKISTTGYCCKTLLIKVMWNRNWVNYCICQDLFSCSEISVLSHCELHLPFRKKHNKPKNKQIKKYISLLVPIMNVYPALSVKFKQCFPHVKKKKNGHHG